MLQDFYKCTCLPMHSLHVTGVYDKLLAWQLFKLSPVSLLCSLRYYYIHNDNYWVTLEGGLKGRAFSVAKMASFLLDVAISGASAASYFHCKHVGNIGLGFSDGYIKKGLFTCVGFYNVTFWSFTFPM